MGQMRRTPDKEVLISLNCKIILIEFGEIKFE